MEKFEVGDKVVKANGEKWASGEEYKLITEINFWGEEYRLSSSMGWWDEKELKLYEEVKEMKELTFKEVIANIKEGEVWINEVAPISFIRLREGGVLDFNENEGINLSVTYKLQRKKYTFEEAFKAYEEGKEIESKEFKYKKINGIDGFKLIRGKYGWNECEDGFEIHLDEIRGKWYIND